MTTEAHLGAPLEGTRVLDLSRDVAGPYATKLLADYGADVLKLEPLEGDPSRRFGPFIDDCEDLDASGLFLHLNTHKRSAKLDPSTPEGADVIRRLARDCDIVVEDYKPGSATSWGWGWSDLSRDRDDLVMVSITPFGQYGPYRDYRGSEITLQAMGGPMITTGHASKEPLKLAGHVAYYGAGAAAALAVLLVRYRVEAGGEGDYIDLSVYECQAGFRDRRVIDLTAAAYTGHSHKRRADGPRMAAGVRPTLDGYLSLYGLGNRLPSFLALIGREDLVTREELFQPVDYIPDDLVGEVESSYREFLRRTPKLEALRQAQELGVLGGALLTTGDLLADPHVRGRDFWDVIEHPHTGALEYPGRPFIMSASPRREAERAPLLGEHSQVLSADPVWFDREVRTRPVLTAGMSPNSPPLEGIRIAAATVVWAGPHVTQLLAEWGAEVIRAEPITRVLPTTRGAEVVLTKEQLLEMVREGRYEGRSIGADYPDMDPKDDRWNRTAAFNSHARNKKSMTCDISTPEGRETFLRLARVSDVVVENNSPGTFERAGLAWDDLRAINPRLIMLRMPAFGLSGPYRDYRAWGTHAESMVGHTYIRGYQDAGPEYSSDVLSADAIAGLHGAVAVVMALRHRARTGEGQLIELPLAESFISVLGEFVLDYTMNGRETPPQGNSHRNHVPHGVYPTRGEDQWIAIDVATNEEFATLCDVLGGQELATDSRFSLAEGRREHRAVLDDYLVKLTQNQDKEVLFHALQAVGICAAPTHLALEALEDPQLNAREWFREITMPTVGTHRYPGYLFKIRNTTDEVKLPPPRLGEHNEEVYLDLLGYSREEYSALVKRGLVGTRYPPEVLPA